MKKLNKASVVHLASLANLNLTAKEIKKFQKELSSIFEFINIVKQAETKGVKPTFQPGENKNITRDDQPTKPLSLKQVLKNARQTENGYIKTSRVFNNGQ